MGFCICKRSKAARVETKRRAMLWYSARSFFDPKTKRGHMQIRNMRNTTGAALLGLSIASLAQAQTQFGRLVVFGDSLSDGGTYTEFFKSLNLPGASQVTRFKFTT